MADRVTDADVKEIIETETGVSLSAFITAANQLVTELCTGSGYSDARLKEIERWLAAHFYAMRDPRTASEGAGGVSVSYQSKVDFHLRLTHYGQQAMLLDTDGNLTKLNTGADKGAGITPTVSWLGKESDTETDDS